ncbi:membrane protein [Streptococcus varani]|uniref:Membrane protein n=1 Tax=Streptococcus varani TaxID=1608583 RepID=A0A0E4CTK0_9STRE|nr:DUF3278 domain-containing protein [Streptococcus varani]CQR25797.1 membrane protein [Streptococcus varani]
MNKESFTDKLLKRFYGITGPLDEYRRQQIDRVGNICYVWLTTILIFGNLVAYILGQKHPEIVATIYPLALTFIGLLLYFIVAANQGFDVVQAIDVEELDEKEKKQLQHVGLKSGLLFGISMWLFGPLLLQLSYPAGLFAIKTILFGVFNGLMFGVCIQVVNKARQ